MGTIGAVLSLCFFCDWDDLTITDHFLNVENCGNISQHDLQNIKMAGSWHAVRSHGHDITSTR